MINYPLKFEPILKEKIWGGEKLSTLLGKKSTSKHVGESWEISSVPGNISIVANGPLKGQDLLELIRTYKGDLLGDNLYKQFGNDFPLLIKFIDAKTDLSVQLHPNDKLAKQRHNSFGKTEMWYILQADEGARLNIGFKKSLDKKEYLKALENGELVSLLHFEKVKPGDAFFIPTGKVHAIGGGVLLAEIQQTSDITYRIYDWDRLDDEGKSRELHTGLAIDAIDFEKKDDYNLPYSKKPQESVTIATCEYFTTNHISIVSQMEKDYSKLDSFVIYIAVKGELIISTEGGQTSLKQGESLLLPAAIEMVTLKSQEAEILEVYI